MKTILEQGAFFINATIVDVFIRIDRKEYAGAKSPKQLFFGFIIIPVRIHRSIMSQSHMSKAMIPAQARVNKNTQIYFLIVFDLVKIDRVFIGFKAEHFF